MICDVRGEFGPRLSSGMHGAESTAVERVAVEEADGGTRVLHPGFRDGWRRLRKMSWREDRPSVRVGIDLTGDDGEHDLS